ncbi:MAG: response regulator [Chloroflexi bacterium]|nr:response regulator [Chloroflexota bacterium]
MGSQLLPILLVEDDEIDREMFIRCLSSQKDRLEITPVSDATAALAILRGQPGQPSLSRPYTILLDLGLPGMSGFEFLQIVRQDPALSTSTVFILTASDNPADRATAAHYHVAEYLLKDRLDAQCSQLVKILETYQQNNFFAIPTKIHP